MEIKSMYSYPRHYKTASGFFHVSDTLHGKTAPRTFRKGGDKGPTVGLDTLAYSTHTTRSVH